ncbi:MBL fold metallo-hydrolase [Gillisia sp. Hel_I_29]|uniref:MBL fold metallo-hydrolase n=1 Tax=Gillisia sp. Hel_I_29 TaxID=1249975 RepID=UPI000550FB4F|nr:MBL fold metallo-hydrolase [Gillisia sp. Hel_I_29]
MKKIVTILALAAVFTSCKNEAKDSTEEMSSEVMTPAETRQDEMENKTSINITPISHATSVILWDKTIIYTDPVGGAAGFEGQAKPSFVLITDIHQDHMEAETLKALQLGETKIIVPKAVQEKLPQDLQKNLIVMNNGDSQDFMGFNITAIPMYNLPESPDAMHTKGRGNGYVLEKDGQRLYIAGDTEDVPEMRNLKNIDIALVPMNLPYTMTVEDAAKGVLAFQPKKVIPYHYRGKDGLADVEKFKELVNKENKDITVELLEWYPTKG